MSKQTISTTDAPAAIGPYSQAVRVGNVIWVSGQIPLDPATKELVGGDIEAQVRRMFAMSDSVPCSRVNQRRPPMPMRADSWTPAATY